MMSVNALESSVELELTRRLTSAREGRVGDAAIAAALIHLHPLTSRRLEVGNRYDELLSQVLLSNDAELIVCVAEELTKGKNLAVDAGRAQRFFDRADKLSPFMAAYALGKLVAPLNGQRAVELFAKASNSGHIPSIICKHRVLTKKMHSVGKIVGLFFGLYDFVLTWTAILEGSRLHERFWRYRDVFPMPLKPVDERVGAADRANIFAELGNAG